MLFFSNTRLLFTSIISMLIPLKIIASSLIGITSLQGICGYYCRQYMGKDRPLTIKNKIDPRIKKSEDENIVLRLTRIMDILLVRYSMKYIMHVRNKVHHYGLGNLYSALERPKDVGLLTVCNHVTTLDSASIIPSMVPISQIKQPRNIGAWNLGAEDIMFNSLSKSMICSLIKIMPINRKNGGVFQMALNDFSRRGMLGDWIHMFPEGRTYQDQLKCCRDEQGCRFRKSGRKAPPGRDLGPLKWGVGKVISDIIMNGQNGESHYLFKNGINHGKLIVIPYYHLNMEKVMPEDENLKVISFMPRGGNDVFCMFGEPIDFCDIIQKYSGKIELIANQEEKEKMQYQLYKEITDRVEMNMEKIEYQLKELRDKRVFVS